MKKFAVLLLLAVLVSPALADACKSNETRADDFVDIGKHAFAAGRYEMAARCYYAAEKHTYAYQNYAKAAESRELSDFFTRAAEDYENASAVAKEYKRYLECGNYLINATDMLKVFQNYQRDHARIVGDYIGAYECYGAAKRNPEKASTAGALAQYAHAVKNYEVAAEYYGKAAGDYAALRKYEDSCLMAESKAKMLLNDMREYEGASSAYSEAGDCYLKNLKSGEDCEKMMTSAIAIVSETDPVRKAEYKSLAGQCYLKSTDQLSAYKCFDYISQAADLYLKMGMLEEAAGNYYLSPDCFKTVRDISNKVKADSNKAYESCISLYSSLLANAGGTGKGMQVTIGYSDGLKECVNKRKATDYSKLSKLVNDYVYAVQWGEDTSAYHWEALSENPLAGPEKVYFSVASGPACNHDGKCDPGEGAQCPDCQAQSAPNYTLYFIIIFGIVFAVLAVVLYSRMQQYEKSHIVKKLPPKPKA